MECLLKLLDRLKRFASRTQVAARFADSVAKAAAQAALLVQWFHDASADSRLTWDTRSELDLRIRYSPNRDKPEEVMQLELTKVQLPLAVLMRAVQPVMEYMSEVLGKLEGDVNELDAVLGRIDPDNTFFQPPVGDPKDAN